jgi:hypothetical protein
VIVAGVKALDGDRDGAMAGYRHVMTMYRDLGLVWDEARLGYEAAHVLGVDDAEIVAWVDRARATFTRLRAKPMLALLDGLAAAAGPSARVDASADLAPAPDGATG